MVNINQWYQDTLTIHPDKIDVVYDPDVCRGVGVDPDSHILTLGPDRLRNTDCPNTVHAPISNTDTLAHEYAHFVFLETYDELESAYPSSRITDPKNTHSPVHENPAPLAWLEGWAFFMATAYSGTPLYQPSYMEGQWNFETRTHTETADSRFAGKSFVQGHAGEGSVAGALWDMIDTTVLVQNGDQIIKIHQNLL